MKLVKLSDVDLNVQSIAEGQRKWTRVNLASINFSGKFFGPLSPRQDEAWSTQIFVWISHNRHSWVTALASSPFSEPAPNSPNEPFPFRCHILELYFLCIYDLPLLFTIDKNLTF